MVPYKKYKSSEVGWIGNIPEHWTMRKVSRSFLTIGSGTTPPAGDSEYYVNGTIDWVNTGDLNDGVLNSTKKKITKAAFDKFTSLKIYPKDTLLIAMYGATIGKVAILGIEACTNQACCALARSELFVSGYVFYWFLASKEDLINLSYGGGQPNISQEVIRGLQIPCPPYPEQITITNFLSGWMTQIDSLIKSKANLIELLEEERTAIIDKAVTRGIDENAKLKPSYITWLGDIPEHWQIKKLKYLTNERLKYGANESAEQENPEHPRYIRITDFGDDGKLRDETYKSLPPDIAKDYLLKNGDILFARSGATVGKTFQFKNYNGVACYAGYLIKASPDEGEILSDFLYLLTQSGAYNNWKNSIFSQATIQNIGADKYSIMEIAFPDTGEQKDIIKYIRTGAAKIDATIEKIELEIKLLREYRKTLISEVVTGKIKVV